MKLVKPSIEFLNITDNPLKAIEIAGRTCYKSEDKITEDSAEKFVAMLLNRGHEAMIEHSNFILKVTPELYEAVLQVEDRAHINMTYSAENGYIISGNATALMNFCREPYGADVEIQRGIARCLVMVLPLVFEPMLKDHLGDPGDFDFAVQKLKDTDKLTVTEKLQHQVMSYRIVCDRGVTHEIVRHRLFSYAQESTRYCNYKGGVEFIIPPWIAWSEGEEHINEHPEVGEIIETPADAWIYAMQRAENYYKGMVANGWTPQQARSVLPNSLKTEIVVTGNLREWRHFFKLRCAKAAHPQMQEVANMVLADIQQRVPVIFDDMS